jgi:uncharacterized protein (DUF1499 family)
MLKWVALGIVLLIAIALVLPRMVSDDPVAWSVDPSTVTPPDSPNSYLVTGHDAITLPLPPSQALDRIHAIAMDAPRTRLLSRDNAAGRATYVQRSAIFGFPDYISIGVVPAEGGSRLSIYSRSRFGYSDLGANKARVEQWLDKIE